LDKDSDFFEYLSAGPLLPSDPGCRIPSRDALCSSHRLLDRMGMMSCVTPLTHHRIGTVQFITELLGVMFFFFSNAVGLAGSILVSVLLTLLLLYACSGT
jgi:hypothetical protein